MTQRRSQPARRRLAVAGLLALVCGTAQAGDVTLVEFNRDIRPILSDNCFQCHGPDANQRKAKLRLDTESGAFRDADGVRPFVVGKPSESEVYRRITTDDADDLMPPADSGRTLTDSEKELIRRWIGQGAKWQNHWAFIPPKRPGLPLGQARAGGWTRNAIDPFILAKLRAGQLAPSPVAAKRTLIRRATLDLTGLPPTPAEIGAFVADESPNAYGRLVNRLLASPRYGEHMAQAWLDAARYADTNGFQADRTRNQWHWRDWVVAALNRNMPFDQFTIEQLAGDLLPEPSLGQLIATGFNRNHMLNGEGGAIAAETQVEYVVDRVETTGTVWLGLTVGCARCHDHKYDPISQREFYQLFAFFNAVPERGGGDMEPTLKLPTPEQAAKLKQLETALAKSGEESTRAAIKKLNDSITSTMVMRDTDKPRDTFLLVRGVYDNPDKSQPIQPGVPASLPGLAKRGRANRLDLARWLTRPDHPLTARVAVNRYWQHFFGAGLVRTTEDFGAQGERPEHPRLLDWLATEFVQSGWNVKHLHRLIVTSAAYRQASAVTPELLERDPQNRLIARGPRLRMSAQTIRDQALALAGLLVERTGGPPVKPYQPPGVWADFSFGKIVYKRDGGAALYRRSLYTFWRRSMKPAMFFDNPARRVCSVRPSRTNTPMHALNLLNDTTYVEAARCFAEQLLRQPGSDADRLGQALAIATGRPAKRAEIDLLAGRLAKLRAHYAGNPESVKALLSVGEAKPDPALDGTQVAALTGITSLILNLDEVITKE